MTQLPRTCSPPTPLPPLPAPLRSPSLPPRNGHATLAAAAAPPAELPLAARVCRHDPSYRLRGPRIPLRYTAGRRRGPRVVLAAARRPPPPPRPRAANRYPTARPPNTLSTAGPLTVRLHQSPTTRACMCCPPTNRLPTAWWDTAAELHRQRR